MDMKYNEYDKNSLRIILAELDELMPFNDKLQMVRVKITNKYYDIHLSAPAYEIPNPSRHLAIVTIPNSILISQGFLSEDDKYQLPPGVISAEGVVDDVIHAYASIINKKTKINVAHPPSPSAAFAINDIDTSQLNAVTMAITPSTGDDYTNIDNNINKDNKLGIFYSNKSIIIKTAGGSISLGEEGIHFTGEIHWEHTKHSKEIFQDNPLNGFVPETIITFPAAIPYYPNMNTLLTIANTAQQLNQALNILNG